MDGKQGLEGPQGPPGVADFTKCSYKSYEKKNIMKTNDPESSETISTYIPASTVSVFLVFVFYYRKKKLFYYEIYSGNLTIF